MRQALLGVTFLLFSAGVALGADHDSAREHYVKGTRAFELGLYDEAIAEYMAAYKIKDDPALLFNIGQAHRLAGHAAEALRLYKTYLAKVPDAINRAEVEAKMADLSRQLEQQKQGEAMTTPAQAATAPPVAAPSDPPPEPSTAISPASPPSNNALPEGPAPTNDADASATSTAGRGLRLAGVVSAAGGLALVGTGIVFGVLAKRAGDDLSKLDRDRGIFDPGKESAGERDQLLAGVFLGVGTAAVATGAILYILGVRDGRASSRSLVLAPSVVPHGAGATLRMVY